MSATQIVGFAASAVLLTAVLVVWNRGLRRMIGLLAWQGVALAAVALARGADHGDGTLVAVGVAVLLLRGVVLPGLLVHTIRPDPDSDPDDATARTAPESTPIVNTAAELLATGGLVILAFATSQPLVRLDPARVSRAVPMAIAVVLIGVFVMAVRQRAASQAAGFLLVDNGIAATAFLTGAGVPTIVELGASLDLLFAVVVLRMLTARLRESFGSTDLDLLRELRDR